MRRRAEHTRRYTTEFTWDDEAAIVRLEVGFNVETDEGRTAIVDVIAEQILWIRPIDDAGNTLPTMSGTELHPSIRRKWRAEFERTRSASRRGCDTSWTKRAWMEIGL